jgi:hypothetical protein
VTSQEPENPDSADRDIPDTEVIVVPSPASVFVDSTGRRGRLLRRLSYAFGALCMLYGGLVSVSLAGGPVSSRAVLPLPNLRAEKTQPVQAEIGPKPAPIAKPAATSAPPRAVAVTEVLPRRTTERARVPSPPAKPVKSASAKPVKSTKAPSTPPSTKPTPSASPSVSASPVVPPTTIQPPPAPPRPPAPAAGGGNDDETVAAPARPVDEPAVEATTATSTPSATGDEEA